MTIAEGLKVMFACMAVAVTGQTSAVELNNVIGVQKNGNSIVITCDQVAGISPRVKLEAWDDDIIRVWFSPNGLFDYYNSYNSYMIQPGLNRFTGSKVLEMTEQDSFFLIKTGKIAVKVNKSPFGISFYTADMSALLLKQNAARAQTDSISFDRDARGIVEHYYGMPASGGTNIDMRNESLRFDENNNYGWVVPFFMSSAGYGIYMHNEFLNTVSIGMTDPIKITCANGPFDLFFFYGPDLKGILNQYTHVTGKPFMPPKKMLGFNYICNRSQTLNEGDFDNLRSAGHPVDNCITFIDAVINEQNTYVESVSSLLHSLNGASVCYFDVHPHAGHGPGNFSDVKPEDRTYPHSDWGSYKSLLKSRLFSKGVDWLWVDETDAFDETFIFPHLRASFEAMEEFDSRRGALCSRGGVPGCQRFGYPWMGDMAGLKKMHMASLRNGLAGIAHSTHDLAGYGISADANLMMRGIKLNLLNPFTQLNNWIGRHMPWECDTLTQAVYKRCLALHYQLLPYWYSMAWEAHTTGLPDLRPLVLYYADDPNVSNSDEVMIGEWLLYAPAYDSDSRDVYLPKGKWIYYFDGTEYDGPATLSGFTATGEKSHLFVKAGAIIPMGPEMQYVDEKPLDPLTLDIYPSASSSYTLYEDDGKTRAYLTGKFCTTLYECTQSGKQVSLRIGARTGNYVPASRSYRLRVYLKSAPSRVIMEGRSLAKCDSMGSLDSAASGYYYEKGHVYIRFPDNGGKIQVDID